jgi:general secretion pathway protein G
MRRHSGFNLTELLLTVAIMAIVSAIGVPFYQNYKYQAQVTNAINDIKSLGILIREYENDNHNLPSSLNDVGQGTIRDPWGYPYQYLVIPTGKIKGPSLVRKDKSLHPINSDYDLYSVGQDGQSVAALTAKASHDDVIRARNGQFVGLASDF